MIKIVDGDLLRANAEAYVNTVNTVGVMGKGIALQFKRRFPDNFTAYAKACKANEVDIGRMYIYDLGQVNHPKFIINFPTKKHWRGASHIEYIEEGLTDLVEQINRLHIRTVALPALGCSNGGLEWERVEPLIVKAFTPLEHVEAFLFAPRLDEQPIAIAKTTRPPKMTVRAALLLKAFDLYLEASYDIGRTVAQKIAYWIQAAGKDMKLDFEKHRYGPYANALGHFIEQFEGHYISGMGDLSRPSHMVLLPGVIEGIEAVLAEDASDEDRAVLEKVAELMEGFETPYAMELLASLHWLNANEGARSLEDAKRQLAKWSMYKATRFNEDHIEIAWSHLQENGWLKA